MPAQRLTTTQVIALMDPETHRANWHIIQRWIDRDDGVAVYENKNIGSANAGHRKFVSFGSDAAQLSVDDPPERLPDINGQIHWAYMLVGTYRRCCERDDDGDGDCDIHSSRGVLRRARPGEVIDG